MAQFNFTSTVNPGTVPAAVGVMGVNDTLTADSETFTPTSLGSNAWWKLSANAAAPASVASEPTTIIKTGFFPLATDKTTFAGNDMKIDGIGAGTWTMTLNYTEGTGDVTTQVIGFRAYQVNAALSSSTLIPTIGNANGWKYGSSITATTTGYTITATSVSSVSFSASTPYLYIELVVNTTAQTTGVTACTVAATQLVVPSISYSRTQTETSPTNPAAVSNTRGGSTFVRTITETGSDAFLSLPGTSGNFASTPDDASLDIVGDIDLRCCAAPTDWTPAALQSFIAKDQTASTVSYGLFLIASGKLRIAWTTNGSSIITVDSSLPVPAVDGQAMWVRATMQVNDGAGNLQVKFYFSSQQANTDPASVVWNQIGTTGVAAGVTTIFSSTSQLEVGSTTNGTANLMPGRIYYAEVRNGYDGAGSIVASPSFPALTPGTTSFVDGASKTWTLNGTASVAGAVRTVPATVSNTRIYNAFRTQTETVGPADITSSRVVAFNRLQTETTPTQPAAVSNTRGGSTFSRTQSETTPTAPAAVTNTRTAAFNRTQTIDLTSGGGTTTTVVIAPIFD